MLTSVYSWPLPYYLLLNGVLMIGCIYYIVREKNKKKLYIPILYILIIGIIVSVINKCVQDNENLIMYSDIVKCLYYAYLVFFVISIVTICIIGINRKNDPNINKPMVYTGLALFIFGVAGFFVIMIMR